MLHNKNYRRHPALESRWKRRGATLWAIALSAAVAVTQLAAYEQPLSSESVREAYFLGQRMDGARASFLAEHSRWFPLPATGPHVARVQALTPYAQIVLATQNGEIRGSAMEAERYYRAHASLFLVRVRVYSTPTYPLVGPCKEFSEQLLIIVEQKGPVQATQRNCLRLSRSHSPAYVDVVLSFDADLLSPTPLTVAVLPPEGQGVRAVFDLGKLK